MNYFKYHLIFILSNFLLMIVVNLSLYNDTSFRFYLVAWAIVTLITLMALSYFVNSIFKDFKNIYLLITMYTVSYIVFNIWIASIDPNKVGTFINLLSFYTDIRWLLFNALPFLAGIGIVLLFHSLKKEDYA